jgi:hypothetical protein
LKPENLVEYVNQFKKEAMNVSKKR